MYRNAVFSFLLALLVTSCGGPVESRHTCEVLVADARQSLLLELRASLDRAESEAEVEAAVLDSTLWANRARTRFYSCLGVAIAEGSNDEMLEHSPLVKAAQIVEILAAYGDSRLVVGPTNWRAVRAELIAMLQSFEESLSNLTTYSSRPWGDIAVFSDTLMRHGCSIRR